ncbi:MAG: hypothetical protein A2W31_11420 [Planctomycetes bacterium RBG_16_64_10]|nr:MAG: hypothetical protein A2W31_11420 [Planctomycetes bacterium RBG_16_64_10]
MFAQAVPDVGIATILNASATAVLGFLAAWCIMKTIPTIVDRHSKEIETQATAHATAIKEMLLREQDGRQLAHADSVKLNDTLAALRENCASVHALRNRGDE